MVLRMVAGRRTGENAQDLQRWLSELADCPPISRSVVTTCPDPSHGEEQATWFYVEADARDAVARRRCLSCGTAHDVLDSAEHWTAPRMWSCAGCGQSIAEVAAGVHIEAADHVTWVALAARCVGCGTIDGLTDFNVDPVPYDELVGRL